MVASETSPMINFIINIKFINQINSLLTSLTLLCCSSICCHFFFIKISKNTKTKTEICGGLCVFLELVKSYERARVLQQDHQNEISESNMFSVAVNCGVMFVIMWGFRADFKVEFYCFALVFLLLCYFFRRRNCAIFPTKK